MHFVHLTNLDVGEGHETLDINWGRGAYQVRLDDYFFRTKRENNKQQRSNSIPRSLAILPVILWKEVY